ncbi:hypothetical protein QO207_11645 [Pseudomonas sp. CAN2814]|uniref:hypothetical protein n=1 Tax=Pseudomonas sp. CAN1 TaxID=3046726 RepID=UPI0026485DD6|nr:hypothetical protein [Pseudomonas sp. CAN1]MDN6857240.1 hypothetical protein [Pseudomonas sp. CAN1]
MNDYKAAFDSMAADISAITALLGFSTYPGIDLVLRSITDLVLAKAESQQLRGERDADQARVAELEKLHAIIRVTDTKSVAMKEVCPSCGEQFECFHNGYINQLVQSNETLWATTKAASEQDMYWHDDALALRDQLAELEKQEPVAFVVDVQGYKRLICASREEAASNAEHFEKRGRKSPITALYAAPVAQAGQVPEELTAKINECLTLAFEEIALYVEPDKCRHPRSRARRASALATEIRAALAAAPPQGMPTEAELEAAGLGYPLSKEEAVALWNDRNGAKPAQGGRDE